jgi:outer membrane receptor protein involved in Fe transport
MNTLYLACTDFRLFARSPFIILNIGILTVLLSSMLSAQTTGKISGIITDAQTGEPLIGVNVVVMGTSLGAATDIEGSFFIINIPAGKYNIQISMVGYEKIIQRDIVVNSNRTVAADFKLKPSAVEQAPVIIEAVRPDVEREKTSTSEVVRAEDVKEIAGMHDVNDILGLASDVTDGHFRGGREGEELYTLQGIGIVNPLDNSTGFVPAMSSVEEVEVITSGFGAQYGNAQSGVVNISMKEGKSDNWHSFADFHTRLPGRKHFGASVFDPAGNPYLRTFLDPTTWMTSSEDPNGGGQFGAGNTISSHYGADTSEMVAVARALWAESKKYIGTNYWNKSDYFTEFSTGGPINDKMRLFVALNDNVTWPFLLTEHPDVQTQILGNVVSDVGSGTILRLSGGYGQNNTNIFPSLNSPPQTAPSYYNWLWDHILTNQYQKLTNVQAGLRFAKALSQSTFYEIKVNSFITHKLLGSAPYADYTLDKNGLTIGNMIGYNITSPADNFSFGKGSTTYQDEKSQTYSLDASFTSQVTTSHLLSAGVQSNIYKIDVNDLANNNSQQYTATPFEASLYVQDKMEFQGMIANIGLRWDMWDENIQYNPNIYSPFRVIEATDSTNSIYNKSAMNRNAPIIARLQPRIGISFPVSVSTVFHLNYGSFMQRPSFQYMLQRTVNGNYPSTLGNPTLKPQTTYSYDVGIMQGLGEGFTLDVSGYYKDVQNLIQLATFTDLDGNQYNGYINSDYADIRGFHITLNKRKGNFVANLTYHYSVATGKAAAPSQNVPNYYENGSVPGGNLPMKDIPLDFDRTQNAIFNLTYTTDEQWGFKSGETYLLGDISISSISFARTGRPYTPVDASGKTGKLFSARTPPEYNTNLKISKRIRHFFGTDVIFYVEVLNLFDNKILNYDYIFGTSQTVSQNGNIDIYSNNPIDSPSGSRYTNIYNRGKSAAYGVDQSFALYSNQPRSVTIGFSIDF